MRAFVTVLAGFLALSINANLEAQQPAVAEVDALFAEWLSPGSPGVAVAVMRDGEIVFQRGYGSAQLEYGIPIVPTTVFHVASVTKQFTAFGIALLEQEGRLSVDDDIRSYLPEIPDLGATVTIRHLIHHTSGIRDQWELLAMAGWRLDDVITKQHILDAMGRQRALNFPPGSEFLYSNMGYTLLAEIVERVGGQPFGEWMEDRVFRPLGMASTHMHTDHEHVVPGRAYSYRPGEDGAWRNAVLSYANAGATSLFTTAPDLARWLANFDSGRLGGPALIERMRERAVLTNGDTIWYAFAIGRGEHRGRTTWSHGGGDAGFRSFVVHVPDEGLGVVVLSNAGSFPAGPTAYRLLDLFLGEEEEVEEEAQDPAELEPEVASVAVAPALLDRYAGRYAFDEIGVVEILREGDRLVAEHGGDRAPMVAENDSTFRMPAAQARAVFRLEDGGVTGMLLRGQGEEIVGHPLRASLSQGELAEFEGVYYSQELETFYRLIVTEDGLVARHPRHGEFPLDYVGSDAFSAARWYFSRVDIERDEAGVIRGFLLTGGRVRNLRFERLPAGVLPGG